MYENYLPNPNEFKRRWVEKYPDAVANDGRRYDEIPAEEFTRMVVEKYPDAVTNDGYKYTDFLPKNNLVDDPEVQRNYLKEAGELYTKYWADPSRKAFTATSDFLIETAGDLFPTLKDAGTAMYVNGDDYEIKDERMHETWLEAKIRSDEILRNPNIPAETKRNVASNMAAMNPGLWEALEVPTDRQVIAGAAQSALNAALFMVSGGTAAGWRGTAATAGKFGAIEAAETVASGVRENKSIPQIAGEATKEGATIAGITAGIDAAFPFMRGVSGFTSKLLQRRGKQTVEIVEDALRTQLEIADKTVVSSREVGERLVGEGAAGEGGILTLAEQAAKERADFVLKQTVNDGMDVVTNPKINTQSVARQIAEDVDLYQFTQKQAASKFYNSKFLNETVGDVTSYASKLESTIDDLRNIGPLRGLTGRLESWLKSVTQKGDDEIAAMLQGSAKLPPEVMALGKSSLKQMSVTEMITTKQAIDDIIWRGVKDEIKPNDTRLVELSLALGDDISRTLQAKGSGVAYRAYENMLTKYKTYKDTMQEIGSTLRGSDDVLGTISKMDAPQIEALQNTMPAARWVEAQEALKRYAVESARDGEMVSSKVVEEIVERLNKNGALSKTDLQELAEFARFNRYVQAGASYGKGVEFSGALDDVAKKEFDTLREASRGRGEAQATREAILPGSDIEKARAEIDQVVTNIGKIKSPQQFKSVWEQIPEDMREGVANRLILDKINDAYRISAGERRAMFSPDKLLGGLESIGVGGGGKREIVETMFDKATIAQLDAVYDILKAVDVKKAGPKQFKRLFHATLGLVHTFSKNVFMAQYHFKAAGLERVLPKNVTLQVPGVDNGIELTGRLHTAANMDASNQALSSVSATMLNTLEKAGYVVTKQEDGERQQ